jgi:tRNA synthetases class II (A)
MQHSSLIKEPLYAILLESLSLFVEQRGYEPLEPTPIVSPFWNSTFTPSSSEVFFRHLQSSHNIKNSIYTCQPCIRITDLPLVNDGWHLSLFHMFSSFKFEDITVEDEISAFLEFLLEYLECSKDKLIFTVSYNQIDDVDFGRDLLIRLGISERQILIRHGSSNYQNGKVVTDLGLTASTTGPRIEFFFQSPTGDLFEIGTFLYLKAKLEEVEYGKLFGFVLGVERTVGVKLQNLNLQYLPIRNTIANQLCSTFLDASFRKTTLGYLGPSQMLSLTDALALTSPYLLDRYQTLSSNERHHSRGIYNHYRKLGKYMYYIGDEYGVSPGEFWVYLSQILSIDLENSIHSTLKKFSKDFT